MLVLWTNKESVTWITIAIYNEEWYDIVKTYNHVIFLIELLVTKKVFENILSYSSSNNSKYSNKALF